jgi:hypothetical protein
MHRLHFEDGLCGQVKISAALREFSSATQKTQIGTNPGLSDL